MILTGFHNEYNNHDRQVLDHAKKTDTDGRKVTITKNLMILLIDDF